MVSRSNKVEENAMDYQLKLAGEAFVKAIDLAVINGWLHCLSVITP